MYQKISKKDRRNALIQKRLVMTSQKDLELAIDNTITHSYEECNSFCEKLRQVSSHDNNRR